jgi:type IV pilus assembly protein PilX
MRTSGHRKQAGVALVFALIILLVVSVMGVVALRSSTFTAKVAVGNQLDAMVFEAAESAIAEKLAFLIDMNASQSSDDFDLIAGIFAGDTLVWCVTKSGQRIHRSCANNEYMDARGAITSEARSRVVGFSPVDGAQVSHTGTGGAIIGDHRVAIQGNGSLPGFGLVNRHAQIALRRGMVPPQEIQ